MKCALARDNALSVVKCEPECQWWAVRRQVLPFNQFNGFCVWLFFFIHEQCTMFVYQHLQAQVSSAFNAGILLCCVRAVSICRCLHLCYLFVCINLVWQNMMTVAFDKKIKAFHGLECFDWTRRNPYTLNIAQGCALIIWCVYRKSFLNSSLM